MEFPENIKKYKKAAAAGLFEMPQQLYKIFSFLQGRLH
jgi:hypothetical protein